MKTLVIGATGLVGFEVVSAPQRIGCRGARPDSIDGRRRRSGPSSNGSASNSRKAISRTLPLWRERVPACNRSFRRRRPR